MLKSLSRVLIKTDLLMAILVGYYGRIVGRCGLAIAHGITVNNEMIDLDYQGNVCVVLFDLSIE